MLSMDSRVSYVMCAESAGEQVVSLMRFFLNIVATYGRSLYALAYGLVVGRWLEALGETEFGS